MSPRRHSDPSDYRIPDLWNCWGYDRPVRKYGREIAVDPGAYLRACLKWIERTQLPGTRVTRRSLSQIQGVSRAGSKTVRTERGSRRAGDWIRDQILYAMLIRTTTAWDHDGNGRLTTAPPNELGTFMKSILLLSHLKRMGATVLYLLPVVKVSRVFRKGQLGCPYSAKNFFELEPDQFDGLLGCEIGGIEAQFELLVRCAHRLGMRVILDVAPRTAARDCDWILDHPEWFYWIDRRAARGFRAPQLPGVTYLNPIPGRLDDVYRVPAVRAHLKKFRFAPNLTHPDKWANFVRRTAVRPPRNLLAEIAEHFGVITPPGFSDVINDRQPPWSDVTYLRLFLDHPRESAAQLPDPAAQPPYVLFDTAKASLFQGTRPNRALWRKLSGIIPFYQTFGVDGARIDMAHALPRQLEEMILDRPRQRDPDFAYIAEELGTDNHARAYRNGYNVIIGPCWYMQPRGHLGHMHKLLEQLPALKLPVLAAAETPDTPRAVVRKGGRRFSRQSVVVNCFLPNAVPMINSGGEIFERQPMNLGLDVVPPGSSALPRTDPQAGRLAFFDRFALHWNNRGADGMIELIARAASLRASFLRDLTDPEAYFRPKLTGRSGRILATGFHLKNEKSSLLMLANLDPTTSHLATVSIPRRRGMTPEILLQIGHSPPPTSRQGKLVVTLAPQEAMVLQI